MTQICDLHVSQRIFPGGAVVKNPPANAGDRETRSLAVEGPLKEEVAPTPGFLPGNPVDRGRRQRDKVPGCRRSPEGGGVPHSRILAWESCGQRRPTGFSPWGPKSRTCLNTHTCREGLRLLTNKKLTKHSQCNKMRKVETNTCKKKLNFQQCRINIKFIYML